MKIHRIVQLSNIEQIKNPRWDQGFSIASSRVADDSVRPPDPSNGQRGRGIAREAI
ncbi:MAG: hypothetical protein ABSF32_01260 [Ignavibacteria bacterium]